MLVVAEVMTGALTDAAIGVLTISSRLDNVGSLLPVHTVCGIDPAESVNMSF